MVWRINDRDFATPIDLNKTPALKVLKNIYLESCRIQGTSSHLTESRLILLCSTSFVLQSMPTGWSQEAPYYVIAVIIIPFCRLCSI